MTNNTKTPDNFNYFEICKNCVDEDCCADPWFTFCAKNEIEKIKDKIKDFPKKFQYFLEENMRLYKNEEIRYCGIRKIRGKCIFMKDHHICLIHDVKPLHCRCFPLLWSYEETEDKLIIYMDECPLSPILSKDKKWIENMKKIIVQEVQQMSKVDRFAFSALESAITLQMIDIIDLSSK